MQERVNDIEKEECLESGQTKVRSVVFVFSNVDFGWLSRNEGNQTKRGADHAVSLGKNEPEMTKTRC